MTVIEIKVGTRLEVVEGSWVGRTGTVTRLNGPRHIEVLFDDGNHDLVVACTTAPLFDELAAARDREISGEVSI